MVGWPQFWPHLVTDASCTRWANLLNSLSRYLKMNGLLVTLQLWHFGFFPLLPPRTVSMFLTLELCSRCGALQIFSEQQEIWFLPHPGKDGQEKGCKRGKYGQEKGCNRGPKKVHQGARKWCNRGQKTWCNWGPKKGAPGSRPKSLMEQMQCRRRIDLPVKSNLPILASHFYQLRSLGFLFWLNTHFSLHSKYKYEERYISFKM